jgi:hypothetical protein
MELVIDSTEQAIDEYDAARVISTTLWEQAARMPLDSELRGLALRSANRWGDIAQTRPLSLAPPPQLSRLGATTEEKN